MKKEKRKELKLKRDSLENREYLSSLITRSFLSTDIYINSEVLLLYSSSGSEVSTEGIFLKALEDKKKLAFPVCLNSDGLMEFYIVRDEKDLSEGMYGIKEPLSHCEKFCGGKGVVCVVPALAFDESGYRIGYGKGYYDRFLEGFKGISVGLCYDVMVEQELPTDNYDKKVNCLITDKKIYKF